MATASNPPPAPAAAPVQSVNSPSSRHLRMESPARGVASLSDKSSPSSLLGSFDQERFVALTSELCLYEVIGSPAATSCFLTEDVADAQPEGSENGGVIKKPVWNKPANGVASEVGVVMGAEDSWPALSKSAGATSKASSTDSLKELSHGSLTLSKGMSVGSSSSQEEVVNTIVSATNLASNHESPRSMERGGGSLSRSSITANGSLSQAPNTHSSVVETSPFNPVKSSSSMGESHRDNTHRDVGLRGGSYSGNEQHQSRGPFRRNNNGPQPRGNGSVHHSHGGKRDHDRVKQDWSNTHRSFGSRESLATQQRVASRPFIRGPISNAPFISPPPPPMAMRPYGPPVFYNDMPPHMFYVPGPHPPMVPFAPMFYPIPDPHLPSKIVSQIDYYFSDENLVKDTFLRQKMDCDGWVPISLIATFKKVRELTDNIQLILDLLRGSNVVEIQGEKVRRKGNWMKWIMPPIMHPTGTSYQPPNNSSQDVLAAHILDEKAAT